MLSSMQARTLGLWPIPRWSTGQCCLIRHQWHRQPRNLRNIPKRDAKQWHDIPTSSGRINRPSTTPEFTLDPATSGARSAPPVLELPADGSKRSPFRLGSNFWTSSFSPEWKLDRSVRDARRTTAPTLVSGRRISTHLNRVGWPVGYHQTNCERPRIARWKTACRCHERSDQLLPIRTRLSYSADSRTPADPTNMDV